MEGNNMAMREALSALVTYLNKEVKRTSKCKRCKYNGKTFRSEPCNWHVDCGIGDYDIKASENAMYFLKKFQLQKALAAPARNCDNYDDIENAWHDYKLSHPSSYFDAMHLWRFAKWLFAPATEKEGEGDGR